MAYTDIDDPSAYFQTKLYTGGTAEAKTFDGNSNLKPDWFWSKKRGAVQSHQTADSVRGIANSLRTDSTIAEYTNSETDDLASFDTNGFTFSGTGDTYNGTYQSSSYVAWCWSAGGGTASSNTDGSITSSVSANTTSGFSIVSYTGTGSTGTVGHGLGATPSMIIIKERNNSTSWIVYHHKNTSAPATDYLLLNSTQATDDYADYFNDTAPTSSVFTIDTAGDINGSSDTYIAYCFAEKKGFSKFGSYTGNGNADGTFVYTGFSPSFVMVKASSTTGNWTMFDNKRSPFNFVDNHLYANTSAAEQTASAGYIDFLSNGFKKTDTFNNASGQTYIYMAFAESPFVTSTGIPTTAR